MGINNNYCNLNGIMISNKMLKKSQENFAFINSIFTLKLLRKLRLFLKLSSYLRRNIIMKNDIPVSKY